MSSVTPKDTSLLAERFAEIYQMSQEQFRDLLAALRDESVDVDEFAVRAAALSDGLVNLKRIRVQLRSKRKELSQLQTRA